MHDITEPLRLAVGSHSAGSGRGCAMNLISWENGDTVITDMPDCADPMLARIVQRLNDNICTHRANSELLCPPCSQIVLELGHRTVGTGHLPLTSNERRIVWVKVAIDQARAVQHLVPERYRDDALRAIRAAETWVKDPTDQNAADAANAAYANAAAYAAYANAAAYAAANAAANAAAYAAYAANAAAYAADAADAAAEDRTGARLALTRRAFDLFEQLTDHVRVDVTDEQIAKAYACMTAPSH